MDFIELLKVVFLGIVEGITEWLPISSTGTPDLGGGICETGCVQTVLGDVYGCYPVGCNSCGGRIVLE